MVSRRFLLSRRITFGVPKKYRKSRKQLKIKMVFKNSFKLFRFAKKLQTRQKVIKKSKFQSFCLMFLWFFFWNTNCFTERKKRP
ncbi:MAG: hypothetical protein CSA39_02915 [Flavobacteriales bacterium]|nr:MAG: hypothetical protein CSA39_02915 [Flavobacteriales bacterium]